MLQTKHKGSTEHFEKEKSDRKSLPGKQEWEHT